jgi:hypothetical protein
MSMPPLPSASGNPSIESRPSCVTISAGLDCRALNSYCVILVDLAECDEDGILPPDTALRHCVTHYVSAVDKLAAMKKAEEATGGIYVPLVALSILEIEEVETQMSAVIAATRYKNE